MDPELDDLTTVLSLFAQFASDPYVEMVKLTRKEGRLGLALETGETQCLGTGVYISNILPYFPASESGRLFVGDRVLAANSLDLRLDTTSEQLGRVNDPVVLLIRHEYKLVTLHRDMNGIFGFTLEPSNGWVEITGLNSDISRSGVRVGQRIVAVNGINMTGRPFSDVTSAITLVRNELTLMVANADRAGTDLQSGDMNPLTRMQTSNDKEQELCHVETQCEEKDQRIENLSDENARLQREKEALLHQLEVADVRCQILQAEGCQMEVTLDHLETQCEEKDRRIENLSDENSRLQREKETLLDQLEEADVRFQKCQAEEDQMEVTLDHLRELNQEKDSSIQKLQQLENVLKIDVHEVELTEQRLGGGAYGEVRVGYWRGQPVAVKSFFDCLDSDYYLALFQQEIAICSRVRHPNIVSFYGATTVDGTPMRIVTRLLEGSLSDVIQAARLSGQPLSLREKIDLAADFTSGVNYLHQVICPMPIVHGDIRSSNVVVTSTMEAQLCDLGTARFVEASLSAGLHSPEYLAPERSRGGASSREADVYSLAVTVVELMIGLKPNRDERHSQVERVDQAEIRQRCIRMILPDPVSRPSAQDCLDALKAVRKSHPYKECSPKRMVKGRLHGGENVELMESPWC